MTDTLDPTEIELWFADKVFTADRLKNLIATLAALLPAKESPSQSISPSNDFDPEG
jgi:hypothetical protein